MTIPYGVITQATLPVIRPLADAQAAQKRQTMIVVALAVLAFLFIGRARGSRRW